ncbi:hypothetical protein K402DRAFT_300244, partial [Aulographum hederae CBS 113979]
YLLPPTGITFISDVDDILRVAKIWSPGRALLATLSRPFVPWGNMPSIYAHWRARFPTAHFNYLSITPSPLTPAYLGFLSSHYPAGSFTARSLSSFFHPRLALAEQAIAPFPNRTIVLVGDTSNNDILKVFPELAHRNPQISCILLRDTGATDQTFRSHVHHMKAFESLPEGTQYFLFREPDDIRDIDFASGGCRNESI